MVTSCFRGELTRWRFDIQIENYVVVKVMRCGEGIRKQRESLMELEMESHGGGGGGVWVIG